VNDGYTVIKFLATGVADASFGVDGVAAVPQEFPSFSAGALVHQADGKVLVAGTRSVQGTPGAALMRLDASGMLDPSFGDSGQAVASIGDEWANGRNMALQPDGRILVSGPSGTGKIFIARFLNGVNVGIGEGPDRASGLTLYPNPVMDEAVVEFNGARAGSGLIVMDATGRRVQVLPVQAGMKEAVRMLIALGGLAPGSYSLILRDGDRSSRIAFIKL
jgi:uncharacterized delta-60 repeat protein